MTNPDRIKEMLASAGGQFAAHDPTTWPDQAKMAEAGHWDQLRAWQSELQGGRVVGAVDDLTAIEGIGPKIEELLIAAGIMSPQSAATGAQFGGLGVDDPQILLAA